MISIAQYNNILSTMSSDGGTRSPKAGQDESTIMYPGTHGRFVLLEGAGVMVVLCARQWADIGSLSSPV